MIGKVRSLIYRELLVGKKSLIMSSTVSLILMIFGWLIALSTRCGNLRSLAENESGESFINTLYTTFKYCVPLGLFFSTLATNTVITDLKTKWRTYSMVLPASPYIRAFSLIALSIALTIPSYILSCINCNILCSILDKPADNDAHMIFGYMLLSTLIISCFMNAGAIYSRNKLSLDIYNVAAFAVIFGITYTLSHKYNDHIATLLNSAVGASISEEDAAFALMPQVMAEVTDKLREYAHFVPFAIIAAYALYFVLLSFAFRRREK